MRVLITGASKGIGCATAEIFLNNGYDVEAPSHDILDLNSIESVKNYVESLKNTKLDAIINNAGINVITDLEEASDSEINEMMMVDLIAPMYLLRGTIPRLNDGGRIVNIGSIWSVVSKSGRSLYSAAKSGMHGITNALALELASRNILVNTICPGFVLTELTKKNNTIDQIKEIEEKLPLKRMADPSEIARLIYFMASKENTYITGQKIIIDGGYTVQ